MSDGPTFQAHPLASAFPKLGKRDLDGLSQSIKLNGLEVPIVLYEGQILDGRNRYDACRSAGVEPRFTTYAGPHPREHVLSLNLDRRHLQEGQKAIVAARMVLWKHGGQNRSKSPADDLLIASQHLLTRDEAAKRFDVSPTSIDRARDLLRAATATTGLIRAVETGLLQLNTALQAATLDPDAQDRVVEELRAAAEGEREGRKISPMEEIRKERNAAVVNRQLAVPSGKFRIVYADPPWDYGPRGDDVKSTADHYPTMLLEDIKAIPVRDWAEDDSILFLWTTSAFLKDSFSVIEAWGFRYVSQFIWDKIRHNLGHYCSIRHELLMIGVRGSCEPDVRKQFPSIIREERTLHSRKPALVYEIINTLYPRGRRLEMFQRGAARPEWEVWGNEAAQ